MPEAVNPNIIVQQPMVSMATISASDLVTSVVDHSAMSVEVPASSTMYATTSIGEEAQVSVMCY
jgi:hypothetical protein